MKAGFWVAPEGADAAVSFVPMGAADAEVPFGRTGTGTISFLATADAEELVRRCPRAAALLPRLAEALETQRADAPGQLFDLTEFNADEAELVTQVLGEGEVAGIAALPGGVTAHIQEAVMAGLWRVRFTDAGDRLVADYLEVSAIPEAVRQAAALGAAELAYGEAPAGAMNVMPILAEIDERMARHRPADPSHTINFTLLPMSEVDMGFLQATLGDGRVQLVSRGYGTCRVLATGARHVWSVQYFNALDAIILDTLEIGDVPVVACAAEEDFRDSAERLREIRDAYFQ